MLGLLAAKPTGPRQGVVGAAVPVFPFLSCCSLAGFALLLTIFEPLAPGAKARSRIAPGAHAIGDVTLGLDVAIRFGAVLRGDNEKPGQLSWAGQQSSVITADRTNDQYSASAAADRATASACRDSAYAAEVVPLAYNSAAANLQWSGGGSSPIRSVIRGALQSDTQPFGQFDSGSLSRLARQGTAVINKRLDLRTECLLAGEWAKAAVLTVCCASRCSICAGPRRFRYRLDR